MKKNQMKKSMALLLAAVMLVSGGCGANTAKKEEAPKAQIEVVEKQDAGKVTFTDDLGREVTVERPKRVACLISSFSDIWYQAGGVGCGSNRSSYKRYMEILRSSAERRCGRLRFYKRAEYGAVDRK